MKGSIAAQLMAAAAVNRSGIEIESSVVISDTCDEETGGQFWEGFLTEKVYAVRAVILGWL